MLDTRPLTIIMDDEIPYARWEREQAIINRAGFDTWEDLLRERHHAKGRSQSRKHFT